MTYIFWPFNFFVDPPVLAAANIAALVPFGNHSSFVYNFLCFGTIQETDTPRRCTF